MPPDSLDANASRLGNRSRWQSRDRMQSACSIPLLPRHHGRLGVICSILLGRSFRNKSSKDMAFPHPQSRKDHYRKEDKPSCGGIVWKFFKRTINITEYRNGKDDVNPAKNRTLGGIIHGRLRERGRCIVLRSPRFTTFEPPEAVGRFNTELLCVLGVQSLPAAELHGLGADDASNRLSREEPLKDVEANVPARGP